MKILIYFSGKLFEPKGTPIRVVNILTGLVSNGAEIFYAGYEHPENIPQNNFLFLSAVLKRPFSLIKFINKNKIEIFYIQTSAGLWLAPFVSIFTKAKCGVDFHGLRIEEEKVYDRLGSLSYNFRKFSELFLCLFLNFATGASYKLKEYYAAEIGNFYVLPVGVDLKLFNSGVVPDKEVMSWKGKSILIGYAGNMKWYQGIDMILSVFNRINMERPGLFKLLIVSSSVTKEFESYISDHGLTDTVKILGKQSHLKVPSLLAAADILAIVRPSDMVTEYAFPSKFSEYAALGKAIVVSRVGDMDRYVENSRSAVIIEAGDINGFYRALINLENFKLRAKLGVGAEKIAKERFNIDFLNKELFKYLRSICTK